MSVILETSLGDLTVDLYTDERPKCCENFLKLCKVKYYNWSLFHSVQTNLVAQAGDPTDTGRGGSSIYEQLYGDQARFFDAEIKPRIKHHRLGAVSMVNNGANQHGSQFFITLAPEIDYLDGTHTVFGEVAEGLDVLEKFNEVYVDDKHRPYKDVRIYHTVVLDDPYPDPSNLAELIPPESPPITAEQIASDRIGAEEEIDDFKGKTDEQVNEILSEKEARANAQLLEMVGDLPSAEVAPDDNVLFVCKLNPVTTADDLEIIFSRFGDINSCEVIKDEKTGESLQYAFIEFKRTEDCESAYFKMDNVLIDDRRIHVDFSQSVAKKQGGRQKGSGVDTMNRYMIRGEKKRNDGYDLVFSDDEDANKRKRRKSHTPEKKKRKSPSRDQQLRRETPERMRKRAPESTRRSPPLDKRRKRDSPKRRKSPSPNRRRESPHRRQKFSPSRKRRESPIARGKSPEVRKRRESPPRRVKSPSHESRKQRYSPDRRKRQSSSSSKSPTPEKRRKRNSSSPNRRKRESPSPDRRRKNDSPDRRRKRDSTSPDRRRKTFPDSRRKRDSPSPDRKRKRDSPSPEKRRKRDPPSPDRRRKRDSPSPDRRRKRDSPSPDRRRKRDSPSPDQRRKRDSPSPDRRQKRKSLSPERRRKRESPSPVRRSKRESPSPVRKRKGNSRGSSSSSMSRSPTPVKKSQRPPHHSDSPHSRSSSPAPKHKKKSKHHDSRSISPDSHVHKQKKKKKKHKKHKV